MVASKVEYISCITFQSSNDLSHEVLILIIIPVIGDASRPSVEGLARTLGVAGFTIKLWDVDLVIDSPLLFIAPLSRRGVRHSSGATETSSFLTTVTGLSLRPSFALFSPTTSLVIFLFRSHHFPGGSFVLRGVEGASHWDSWWGQQGLYQSISHSQGSDSSGGGGSQWDKWLGCSREITPSVPKPP